MKKISDAILEVSGAIRNNKNIVHPSCFTVDWMKKIILNSMGKEVDLLINYPKSKRNLDERANNKTKSQRGSKKI